MKETRYELTNEERIKDYMSRIEEFEREARGLRDQLAGSYMTCKGLQKQLLQANSDRRREHDSRVLHQGISESVSGVLEQTLELFSDFVLNSESGVKLERCELFLEQLIGSDLNVKEYMQKNQ